MYLDNMDDVRAELDTIIGTLTDKKLAGKLQEILDYLYMVEERL